MNGNIEARMSAMVAAVSALLASHPDREALLLMFDAFAESSRTLELGDARTRDDDLETHDRMLELFRRTITAYPPT